MAKTTNSNYSSIASPGSTFNSRISADADAFDRNDVDALGKALDDHDHTANKGLAVGRLAATTVISGGGTLTWPTSSDTIVGKATADTLTNKTLTSPTINGAALSGTLSGSPTLSGTPTFSGGITVSAGDVSFPNTHIGFFAHAVAVQQNTAPVATDLGTVITLANALKTAMTAFGLTN